MLTRQEIVQTLFDDLSTRTGVPKMPTGIEDVDRLTWGVHKKELMVIAGRTSMGKTSLLLNMAWGLAKNNRCVIFASLEMSKMSIYERLMCCEFGLHGWNLRIGDVGEIKKANEIKEKYLSRLLVAPIEILDNRARTIEDVEKVLSEYHPEALFIDYVQKISSKGYPNKYEAISNYVVRLQSLAIQFDCAIVLSSQLNRGGSGVENAVDNMKGSGEIEESADTILQCRWLCKEDSSRLDQKEFIVNAIKQRHGPCDFVVLDFNASSYAFEKRDFRPKDFS